MKSKAELIVISSTKFGENSIVLHTLSREFGRRGFLLRVSPKASMTLFMPLNILEAEVTENPKSELWHAKNFTCVSPLNGIRTNIYKNTMTLFMGEVLFRVVRELEPEDGLADWVKGQVLALDVLQGDFSNFHLLFLLGLCSALGFSPGMEDLAPFVGDRYDSVSHLLASPFEEALLLPLNGEGRNEIAASILKYISHHTESSLNVRSLAVLRDIFG
ncbi:MAG: DNA repair protein RecO [Candidatus Cryptobacteroides sp.]